MKTVMALVGLLMVGVWSIPPAAAQLDKPYILERFELAGELTEGDVQRAEAFVEQVNEDPKVKAVLLTIDSPGGTVSDSSQLYDVLGKIRVPVVAWCDTVCASGGLYVAMAPSVKYFALRKGAITGSIGVIATVTEYSRLLDWARITVHTFKSGTLKDAGNPTRAMTDVDRDYIQSIVTSLAEEFYAVVREARPNLASPSDLFESARIVFAAEAVDLGLADAVLTEDEAIEKAKALSGVEAIYTREELKKMAKAVERSPYSYSSTQPEPAALDRLVTLLEEVRSGVVVRFEYRLPYVF